MPAVTLSTRALIKVEELNDFIGKGSNDDVDKRKIRIINQLSLELENLLDRYLVTAGTLTEYHTPYSGQLELVLGEYPVTSVTSVHVDTAWQTVASGSRYGAAALLVADTDYLVIKPTREPDPIGKLLRLNASWTTGRRVVKVVYVAGYATTLLVPEPIKAVCLEASRRIWKLATEGDPTAQSWTDQMGTVTRPLPGLLLKSEKERLISAGYRRPRDFAPTWERDAA